jgi:hypothetical protein
MLLRRPCRQQGCRSLNQEPGLAAVNPAIPEALAFLRLTTAGGFLLPDEPDHNGVMIGSEWRRPYGAVFSGRHPEN